MDKFVIYPKEFISRFIVVNYCQFVYFIKHFALRIVFWKFLSFTAIV
jgi:hypothetical protein